MSDPDPRAELRELVEIALLGEATLAVPDEHRIVKVALARGLTPAEARAAIDEALAARGARRAAPAEPVPAAGGPDRPADAPPAREVATAKAPASRGEGRLDAAVKKVISRRMGPRTSTSHRALAEPASLPAPGERRDASDEVVVAELVSAAPELAGVVAEATAGPCSACLAAVVLADVAAARAERVGERLHCRACTSKLRAGLLCVACYAALGREDFASGRATLCGGRGVHVGCAGAAP